MNACHILLGRPWQFDRKVEHDGRANVYSVMKGNVRYNLKPMSPNKIKESKTKKGSMFMEAREVEEALARGKRTYVLLVRELGSVGVCDDRGVQELLEEFRDVFPDELPDGLPPLRGIEHQIDLIPGAALPNKPAYRCNPEEAKELQRQVQELIDRGYVQESLSPCAVPALLVPKKEGTWRIKDEESHKRHLRAVFEVLRDQKLYGKLEKCTFMVSSVVFLGYIVGKDGVSMDPSKVDAIQAWPIPKSTTEVRSFHGLASFYRRFIQGFSSIVAPITELTKKGEFVWTNSAQKAFEEVKRKLCSGPVLALPDFNKLFEVECDASGVGIGAVLLQEKRPIAYFSEKLNGARLNYSTYDKEFYAIVRALDHWSHYLRPKPFILHSDHEALKHIHGQQKLNQRHAKWVEFLQSFTFSSKYKTGSSNVVADALSRRHSLLIELDARILGFEHIKELYKSDPEFSKEIIDPTGRAPFEIVYGVNPYLPIDLVPIPKKDVLSFEAKERQAAFLRVCEQVRAQIEKANAKYKEKANKHRKQPVFKEGDLVWLHLRKERFPSKRKNKLMPRADGPFKILECYGSNAYKLELPSEYGGRNRYDVNAEAEFIESNSADDCLIVEIDKSFKHEGKKVTLTPLPPNQRNYGGPSIPEENNGVLFLSEAAMIKEMKQEQPVWMLLSKEVSKEGSPEIPAEVRPLIQSSSEREHLKHLEAVFRILKEQKLFGKIEKCTFMVEEVAFLGYIVSGRGITIDRDKIVAIQSWPTPKTITEKGEFHWTESAQQSFERIKKLMCETPILKLPDFDQLFEVECDASGVGIGASRSKLETCSLLQ
ncbi:uncharacterized protein LOC141602215 [Silene latifolia]|uniref:uncharacterized protein LOC141602215 n=1 Tax=Silene latifolia TaxID=37657 RepID=UPI003D783D6B